MKYIDNNQELMEIVGGFSITGSIVSAFIGAAKFVYDTGRNLGSSIRRIGSNKLCPVS